MKFSEALTKKHLAFDGGFGTMLLAAGLPAGPLIRPLRGGG